MTAASIKRVYWDACAWIALIHQEKIRDASGVVVEDRETMCKSVLRQASGGAQSVEIVTSALSLVEVCKHPRTAGARTADIAAYFEHDHVLLVNLDRFPAKKPGT